MTTGRSCHLVPRPATTGVLTEGFWGSSFPCITAACPQTAAAGAVFVGGHSAVPKRVPGASRGRDGAGCWGCGEGRDGSTDPLRSSPASPDAGGSPRQRGGGVRGRTALGNIPSHLKGAINHSLFIKSPARLGEKCQEHKSPPPLACKGSWLAKGCKAGSEPPTVPREATARPRSASVPTDKGWGARVPITRPPCANPAKD